MGSDPTTGSRTMDFSSNYCAMWRRVIVVWIKKHLEQGVGDVEVERRGDREKK